MENTCRFFILNEALTLDVGVSRLIMMVIMKFSTEPWRVVFSEFDMPASGSFTNMD